jgi:Super-infection exclusion protein B
MEPLSALFDISKLPTKVVAMVALVSTFILFAPNEWLIRLSLDSVRTSQGLLLGLAFVMSVALLGLNTGIWTMSALQRWNQRRIWLAALQTVIGQFDHAEKAVLREYYLQARDTLSMPVDDPTVAGLLAKRVLRYVARQGAVGAFGKMFPLAIAVEVRRLLSPQSLELPEGTPSPEEFRQIALARPPFAGGPGEGRLPY